MNDQDCWEKEIESERWWMEHEVLSEIRRTMNEHETDEEDDERA